jgi:hypothetical protein
MSWSASGTATVRTKSGGEGVGVRLDMNHSQPQTGHGAVESEKALATAQRVARLLESGAYGTGTFTVGLSGHANPDNLLPWSRVRQHHHQSAARRMRRLPILPARTALPHAHRARAPPPRSDADRYRAGTIRAMTVSANSDEIRVNTSNGCISGRRQPDGSIRWSDGSVTRQ